MLLVNYKVILCEQWPRFDRLNLLISVPILCKAYVYPLTKVDFSIQGNFD